MVRIVCCLIHGQEVTSKFSIDNTVVLMDLNNFIIILKIVYDGVDVMPGQYSEYRTYMVDVHFFLLFGFVS